MESLLIIFFCLFQCVVHGQDCARVVDPAGSGKIYDLSPIIGNELTMEDSYSQYTISICKNPYGCGNCGGQAGYCQITEFWQDCVGVFSSISGMTSTEGVEIMYDKGDWNSIGRVKLTCDPSADGVKNVRPDNNNYRVLLGESKYACLVCSTCGAFDSSLSLGSSIMIAVLVITIVYLGAGMSWNYFRNERRGIEMIPNLEIWKGVPILVKDGTMYTVHIVKSKISK
eukprot:TRINITY_DN7925_c0_g1_i1.p1 TRINITY_DN7925_c0_g1~~TRINITY_DN7925_c0_g1_i1.p1  ORF type:complete len:227 (-),score=18.70 TRINITY_DN7925_c0_g1_i1:31-711(-)